MRPSWLVVIILGCAVLRVEAAPKRATEITPPPQTAAIEFANGRLTVKAIDAPLGELLREIARQTGLTVVGQAAPDEKVTVEFRDETLDEALRRILRTQNFAVEYAERPAGPGQPSLLQPVRLWIARSGERGAPGHSGAASDRSEQGVARDARPPVGARDIPMLAEVALRNTDSWAREDAVDALGESGRREAVAPLAGALQDPDEHVRKAATDALVNLGGEDAARALAFALQDEDSWRRKRVVEALGEIGGATARALLRQALADKDEFVRDTAAELLEALATQRRGLPR